MSKIKTTPRDFNIVRQLGTRQRIFGGWKRRDRVTLNGEILRGYVEVVRKGASETTVTVFVNAKGKRQESEGYDWEWLAHRNGRMIQVHHKEPELRDAA
jgi:hypothetical protein